MHKPVVRSQISLLAQVNPHCSVPPQPSEIGPHRPGQAAVAVDGTHTPASAVEVSVLPSAELPSPAAIASDVPPPLSAAASPPVAPTPPSWDAWVLASPPAG
jgi:hypothetical protein